MKKVAIIEDGQHIGDILERTLAREGYGTLRAYSGTEALCLLSGHMPDLVLLDLMLPGLSSEEILPKIKGIPVIVVSAKAGTDDKVSLLLDGAVDYITKPFDMKGLYRTDHFSRHKTAAMGEIHLISGGLPFPPDYMLYSCFVQSGLRDSLEFRLFVCKCC